LTHIYSVFFAVLASYLEKFINQQSLLFFSVLQPAQRCNIERESDIFNMKTFGSIALI